MFFPQANVYINNHITGSACEMMSRKHTFIPKVGALLCMIIMSGVLPLSAELCRSTWMDLNYSLQVQKFMNVVRDQLLLVISTEGRQRWCFNSWKQMIGTQNMNIMLYSSFIQYLYSKDENTFQNFNSKFRERKVVNISDPQFFITSSLMKHCGSEALIYQQQNTWQNGAFTWSGMENRLWWRVPH